MLFFSIHEHVDTSKRDSMLGDLGKFPAQFPQIKQWQMGQNASERDDTYEFGVTMTFENEGELKAYLNSEEHERFVQERFRPLVSRRAIVTFELPDDGM